MSGISFALSGLEEREVGGGFGSGGLRPPAKFFRPFGPNFKREGGGNIMYG